MIDVQLNRAGQNVGRPIPHSPRGICSAYQYRMEPSAFVY